MLADHLPDLLHLTPRGGADAKLLGELLELAFLGSDPGARIDEVLSASSLSASPFRPRLFASDLFVRDLVAGSFSIRLGDEEFPLHLPFLERVLSQPPADLETVRFRQKILRELEQDGALRERGEDHYRQLFRMLSLFKAPRSGARLNTVGFRLEILTQAREIIDAMAKEFEAAKSGLVRLSEAGRAIQESDEYRLLRDLLDFEGNLSELTLKIRLGADGRIRHFAVASMSERRENPFYRSPWRRWKDDLAMLWRRYDVGQRDVVSRTILDVYLRLAPSLRSLLQVLGHLEVYLASRGFAELARSRGLEVSLADFGDRPGYRLAGLFNPLLMIGGETWPVPCSLGSERAAPITLVTGPNSGGKTRLLQAIGLAQLLGQSGLYVPAAEARLPLATGLFASIIEREAADQPEGRLGSELIRIRTLFESVGPGALVLLDELCSGTNPSEAVEIVSMVLDLLGELRPTAFITTHFLDFAQRLAEDSPGRLEFIQVEIDEHQRSTYQFVPGIASTSLAAGLAHRLGVTFEELSALVERRREGE